MLEKGELRLEKQVFVARERELAQLNNLLQGVLATHGSVCFVTGEAGSGKTALVNEFARCALEKNAGLTVAVGQCNAQTGMGDAHLPFREVLGQLTGDVEAKLAQGAITEENANRLRKLLVLSGQALVEVGPDLIGIFVPGAGLAARVGAFAVEKVGWLEKLEKLLGKQGESTGRDVSGIQQSHIFEQYANVLCKLSDKNPLLLVLDDLQWADVASIGLLFNLARRIGEHRIMLLGTYRPEEVAIDRAGERHPLEKVLAELKRYFGDVWVDLDKIEAAEGRHFIDAYLNTEFNRLEEEFRCKLFEHTGGHPLFTIELLRTMQERGDLVQDMHARWVEATELDWESLPVRVEGVIEERIGRLKQDLRQMLTIGSVEGEEFTAEVVANIQAVEASGLIQRFGGELERQHRLVKAQGVRRIDTTGQRLSSYRFQHNLFQKYIYNKLDEAERSYLHEDVGNALEELYGDEVKEIVVQLARHFDIAGIMEKAGIYLERAGKLAAERYSNDEAIAYFSRALDLTQENRTDRRYDLVLAREQIYDLQGERELQANDLAALKEFAQILGDDRKRAEVLLRQAAYADATDDYPAVIDSAQKAINLAQTFQDVSNQAFGHLLWGSALRHQGEYAPARQQFELAHTLAHTAQSRLVEARSLAGIGMILSRQGDITGTEGSCEQALSIYQELGNLRGEAEVLQILCATFLDFGDYNKAQGYGEQALSLYRQIGYKQKEGNILGNLGIICAQQGDYSKSRSYFLQAMEISQETGDRSGQAAALNNLGNLALRQDDYVEANKCLTQVLGICREIGNRRGEGIILENLGGVAKHQGDYGLTMSYHTQALDVFREIGDRNSESLVLGHLSDIYLIEGCYDDAQSFLEQSLIISHEVGDRQSECNSLEVSGVLALTLGNYSEAKKHLEQSLEITRQIGDRQLEGKIIADLGWLYHCLNVNETALEYSRQAISIGQELGERSSQARALNLLGNVLQAQRGLPEAVDAYQQSLTLRLELNQSHLTAGPLSGLARVYLDQQNIKKAQTYIDEILGFLEKYSLKGTEEPIRIYLTCYRVLMANQDPRANDVLKKAYKLLQERAANIRNDVMRHSYLENVDAHREIMKAFTSIG